MTDEEIQAILISVSQTLRVIDLGDLQTFIGSCKLSLSCVPLIDPIFSTTGDRNALRSRQIEDAKHQLAIIESLLAARQAIDTREAHYQGLRTRVK